MARVVTLRKILMLGTSILGGACATSTPRAAASTNTSVAAVAAAPVGDPRPQMATAPPPSQTSATDILASGRAPFDECYSRGRAVDRQLGRTSVAFTFEIDAAGKPTTIDLQYRNRMDDSAKDCMRDAALRVAFPSSMQGRQTGTLAFTPSPSTPSP
jgi:hypothetical protein